MEAQYLSVPVYLLGGISFFTAATIGDKYGLRGSVLLFLDIFAVIGYALLVASDSNAVKYAACYLIALPLYCGPGLNETWIVNNTAPHYRRATALGLSIFAVIGYALLVASDSNAVKYAACYLIALPLYCGPGLNETWIVNNTAPHYRRATALGLSQAIGNIAGVVAPQVYRKSPYMLGHWSSLGSALISMALISVQLVYYKIQNTKKDKISRGEREDDRKGTTGEENLDFRYVY